MSVSSLQSLNEVLASGSKDVGRAAVEKQVRRAGNTWASETWPKECSDPPLFIAPWWLQVQEVNAQLQKEKDAEIQARQAARGGDQASGGGGGGGGKGWNEDDLQLLIKAVNLFPAGTNAR